MSAAVVFDIHRFVKNLTASGFTEAQAEAPAPGRANMAKGCVRPLGPVIFPYILTSLYWCLLCLRN